MEYCLDLVLIIATLLGGITAIWFLYDKSTSILAWFKLSENNVSDPTILSISDNDFGFLESNLKLLTGVGYVPKNNSETEACISLLNQRILKKSSSDKFKLTRVGKKMFYQK
jgi:hypothetical protein